MPTSLKFLDPNSKKFDNTKSLQKHFQEVVFPKSVKRAKEIVGDDGNLDAAIKIEIESNLKELLKSASYQYALRIVLSLDSMIESVDSYEGKYQDLSEKAPVADSLFSKLCLQGEENSFKKVYGDLSYVMTQEDIVLEQLSDVLEDHVIEDIPSSMKTAREEILTQVREELLDISLEGAHIENIDTLVSDMGIQKEDFAQFAMKKDLPKYGLLIYTLYHNLDNYAEAILDICLASVGDVEGYGMLKDFVDLAIQDNNVQALRLLSRIDHIREFYDSHSIGIIQTASMLGNSNVIGYFMAERGDIFNQDNDLLMGTMLISEGFRKFVEEQKNDMLMASIYYGAPKCFNYLLSKFPNILNEYDEPAIPMAHELSKLAVLNGEGEILKNILRHKDYKTYYPEISNNPHIYKLIDIAAEDGPLDMVDVLLQELSGINKEGEAVILDYVRYLIDSENNLALEATFRSMGFRKNLIGFAKDSGKDIQKYLTEELSKLFSRALYNDKGETFSVMFESLGYSLFSTLEQKALLLDLATNSLATNCIKVMDDDFVLNALYKTFKRADDAKTENEFIVEQRAAINILNEVYKAKGAYILNEYITDEGDNLLMLAISLGLDDLAIHIIDNFMKDEEMQEAAMNMLDVDNQNLIHLAAMSNNPDLLRKVLSMKGAKELVNERDDEGHTPITLAVEELEEEAATIIDILVKVGGADLSLEGKDDLNVIDWATTVMSGRPSLLLAGIERLIKDIESKSEKREKFKVSRANADDESLDSSSVNLRTEVLRSPATSQKRLSSVSDASSNESITSIASSSSDGEIHMDNVGAIAVPVTFDMNHHMLHSCAYECLPALGLEAWSSSGSGLVY